MIAREPVPLVTSRVEGYVSVLGLRRLVRDELHRLEVHCAKRHRPGVRLSAQLVLGLLDRLVPGDDEEGRP